MNEQPTAGPGEDPVVHYQISITARQAATFILGLLVALSLAFFFGMKTGASAKPAPDALTRLSEASDLPVPTTPEEGTGPAPRRTDPDRNIGFAPTPKSAPASASTHAAAPGVPPFAPAPTSTATVSEPPPPQKVTTKAIPTPEPEPVKPGPTATETPKAPAKPASKKDAWWVQVFASNNAASCDEVAAKLRRAKLPADISVHPQKTGWFRVRVGPYADKARADAAAKKVVEADKSVKKPIVSNAP